MKESLNQKLKIYGSLATGILAVGNVADAQTIYVDIDPDTLLTGNFSEYLLDLNNDGIKDYKMVTANYLSVSSGVTYDIKGAAVYPLNGNEVLIDQASSNNYIKALDLNSPIGPNQTIWGYTSSAFILNVELKVTYSGGTYTNELGLWDDVQNKYMGVKFKINNNTHYGWVRMDVNETGDSVLIKSYAYHSVPNGAVTAGVTGVGISDMILPSDYQLFMDEKALRVNFTEALKAQANMKIFDSNGKLVSDNILAEQNNSIQLDLAAGVYMVNLNIDGTIITEKIVVN